MKTMGVTGHQNIPNEALEFVKRGIVNVLHRFGGAFVGVSSLAAGADQIFAEEVLRCGGSLHVVIPCQDIEVTFPDYDGLKSFRRLVEQADFVETLEYDRPSEDAYLAAGHRVVDLSDIVVAVWDGLKAKGKGGTGDIVRYAQEQGKELLIVWPSDITR